MPAGQPQAFFNLKDLQSVETAMGITPQNGILQRLSTLENLWEIKTTDSKSVHYRFADILASVKGAGMNLEKETLPLAGIPS